MKQARPGCGAIALVAMMFTGPGSAWAYDAATTHAGLTEKAVMASSLHKVLVSRMGRPLGVLEPLQLHSKLLPPGERQALWDRLQALDPAQGYRPGNDGAATALAWVVAGAVLAETPPERGRHHFLEPRHREGLSDDPGLTGATHALRLAIDDGATLRQIATGTAFDLTGQDSLGWIASPDNDQGVPAFLDAWEAAVAAEQPAAREGALVRGLLALGGLAAVLQDAGEPAHVRNDFRRAFLRRQGPSLWDRASELERFTADRYGRVGVPPPGELVTRPSLEAFFTAPDGRGLADRTHRRFFSPGTIPSEIPLDVGTKAAEVVQRARSSLEYPSPTITGLSLAGSDRPRYLVIEGRRSLAYVRQPNRIRFFIDDVVHAETARTLLPEIGAYTAGLLDHLLRAGLKLEASGRRVSLAFENVAATLAGARLRFFTENESGVRKEMRLPGTKPGETSGEMSGETLVFQAPAGARKIAAVMRGHDARGPFVAAGEVALE